jgi:uncharacterized membrane protein YcaP (DUF421 family)
MDPLRIGVRALFAFVFLFVLLRCSGKRFVAQATGFDFVLALIIGDLVDDLFWSEVPASQFATACGVLVACQLAVSMGAYVNQTFAEIVGGKATMIVRDGTPLRSALRKERVNEKEVEELLRTKGLERGEWRQVRSAWIEKSGAPGVLKHEWAREVQKKDLPRLRKRAR